MADTNGSIEARRARDDEGLVAVLMPLYGFVRGDTLGLLVLVHDTDTVAELARSLGQAASVRVPADGRAVVTRNGKVVDPALTVAEAGFSALERVDLTMELSA